MIKRFRWLIDLLLLTLIMWVVAGIITGVAGYFLYELPAPAAHKNLQQAKAGKQIRARSDYAVIKERDLFKVAKAGPVADKPKPQEDVVRPVAEMGITLKGTITGPERYARAIIEEKRAQDLYAVGDKIKGARILAIYRNKVILEVNGQEQMLVVEEDKGAASRTDRTARTARRTKQPAAPVSGGLNNIMSNLDEYIGRARVAPYFKGGQPYGFRVSNVDRSSLIYELGVRSGDVIRSVNGIPVRSPEDAFAAYQKLQNESSVDVELERRGSAVNLTVPLQ